MVVDLVEAVSGGKRIRGVQVIGFYDRDVSLPEHHRGSKISGGVKPTMVDIIGVVIKGQTYHAKGQCFAVLGRNTAQAGASGKRMVLLEGTLRGGPGNYVELITKFRNKQDGEVYLYATKTLMRDGSILLEAYPEYVTLGLQAYNKTTGEWDFEKAFKESGIEFPEGYKVASGEGVIEEQGVVQEPLGKGQVKLGKPNKRELENRERIRECPEEFEEVLGVTLEAQRQIKREMGKYIENMGRESTQEIQDKLAGVSEELRRYWRVGSGEVKNRETGRAVFKRGLEVAFPKMAEEYIGGQLIVDSILTRETVESWGTGENKTGNKYVEEIVQGRERLYIGILDGILSMRGKLMRMYDKGERVGVDIYKLIQENPYITTLVDSRLTMIELEKLARLYCVDMEAEGVQKYKNVAYMHNRVLDSNDSMMGSSTVKPLKEVGRGLKSGIEVTKREYEGIRESGMVVTEREYDVLQVYIDKELSKEQFRVETEGWQREGSKYLLEESRGVDVIRDYLSSGLGVMYEIESQAYLTDIVYAQKEVEIIEKMYRMSKRGERLSLSRAAIDACISRFERQKELEEGIKGFKLEERQRAAVHLITEPVVCITGSAGSGKTTTAEAILYVLEELSGYGKESIVACAPTGKAADRLKEVIKRPARTIHSTFRIGESQTDVISEKREEEDIETEILLVDEASMISLHLMYEMLERVDDGTRVIILGDREQLPPIEAGKPYANLLDYLPTVVLNVSKRAKSGSGITRNATKIIEESDGWVQELEQAEDFRLLRVSVEETLKVIEGIIAYHTGGGEEQSSEKTLQSIGTGISVDDIQIISPVNNYKWGVRYLNREIQDLVNPRKDNQKSYRMPKGYITTKEGGRNESTRHYVEFRKGDRVIHTKNEHNRERVERVGSVYRVREDKGVMNGAVGKVVGVAHSRDIDIEIPMEVEDGMTSEEQKRVRDKYKGGRNSYVLEVEYTDIDRDGITSDFIIMYPFEDTTRDPVSRIRDVRSSSLQQLDLAYALTVHKTQGSQAKLVIMVLQNVYGDFISRNLIYTGVTRAEEGVYLIGDVEGAGSILTRGRGIEQNSKRETVGDRIYM